MSNKYEREIEDILKKSDIPPLKKTKNNFNPTNISPYIIKFIKKDFTKLILIVLAMAILMMIMPFWVIITFIIVIFAIIFVKKTFLENLNNNSQEKRWRGQLIEEEEIPWWKKIFNS